MNYIFKNSIRQSEEYKILKIMNSALPFKPYIYKWHGPGFVKYAQFNGKTRPGNPCFARPNWKFPNSVNPQSPFHQNQKYLGPNPLKWKHIIIKINVSSVIIFIIVIIVLRQKPNTAEYSQL